MERRGIAIEGIVQGVGFRPFVHSLASRLELSGFVRNQSDGVWIEVEGEAGQLDRFVNELSDRPPPLAQVERVICRPQAPRGDRRFHIDHSASAGANAVFISPDAATCDDCLAEMMNPQDRRYRYPFLNCTNCGPRLTIVTGAPYDRQRTTMAGFTMCPRCRAEYENPLDRRFHAQPTCCPACGPRLEVLSAAGEPIEADDPTTHLARALLAGGIAAIKGLGGYHLACCATSDAAVKELRRRKHRDAKPFAVMAAEGGAAGALCEISAAERALLESPARPIVLLRKRANDGCASHQDGRERGAVRLAGGVAPGNPDLGMMLPYTPLHHLLMRAVGKTPLVMTSGNRSDEPIAYEDDEAVARLRGVADLFLTHNRPIHMRCDDSVMRVVEGEPLPMRRSRGYAPRPIALPTPLSRPTLAVGGQLKNTFALGRGGHAFPSQHMGDLDHFQAYRAFEKDIARYEQLFAIRPEVIAHDLHPDYASTRYAQRRAAEQGVALLAVQHHHAHMASGMAEHGVSGPVIGVSFDGTGYGADGAVWGGEFLVGDARDWRRAAHLRYVGMPGAEQAIREPWRMALSHLSDAGCDPGPIASRIEPWALRTVAKMLERGLNTPRTSSAGRLFDAAASLAGVRDRVDYEGQAAIELEWLAGQEAPEEAYPFDLMEQWGKNLSHSPLVVDTRRIMQAIVRDIHDGVDRGRIARRFHAAVMEMIVAVCRRIRERTGIRTVMLSGGVFLNVLLMREVRAMLAEEGFEVYRHQQVPPGDGGLCLGQLAVAAARSNRDEPRP